ncbi:MAG: hypothetical protein JWM19_3256 [Actinomycetia bacterium]|nr:hypothetical protein [Actinomycetes bacterium]
MTVAILSLSGLPATEAEAAADALVDIENPTGEKRLDRLLVLDDTALVKSHARAYERLDTAHRVRKLLNVSSGPLTMVKDPRTGIEDRRLVLPGNLGGNDGWPVLWVGRLGGIDLELAKLMVANLHEGFQPTTLERHPLIGLLKVDEMFDRVHALLKDRMRGKVASPGLWLEGADDESASFHGALAVAIRRVSEAGHGAGGPFAELLPARAGGARVPEAGPFARYLGQIREQDREASHALERTTGLGGRFRRSDGEVHRFVTGVGATLKDLRDLTIQMLIEGDVRPGGELAPNQHSFLRNAGLEFEGLRGPAGGTAESNAEQSLAFQAVARAVTGGNPIPAVGKRLAATERELQRYGSSNSVDEVSRRCPAELLVLLASCPLRPPRYGDVPEARQALGLAAALDSAKSLEALIIDVANREWSPSAVPPGEVARIRAAIDGARKSFTDFEASLEGGRSGARAARLASLGAHLLPRLRDLITDVVRTEIGTPSSSGPEALKVGREHTKKKIDEWKDRVLANGVDAQPPFPTSSENDAPYVSEEDAASVREAVLYPAGNEMWQLCGNMDIGVLDHHEPPLAVRFASRFSQGVLKGLPGGDPVWTSSGRFAGVLRLVQLRSGVAESSFGDEDPHDTPDADALSGTEW